MELASNYAKTLISRSTGAVGKKIRSRLSSPVRTIDNITHKWGYVVRVRDLSGISNVLLRVSYVYFRELYNFRFPATQDAAF